ncbi:hypothetical protein O6P43_009284 [Quillaja saponaria]|uniref:Uncharacterized protein n=1 Tax=Quillaja saponaria TaxID=32244 RepID=A0AAD7PXX7_QUISA|nr:hypothetical protein O6P43_009284 [Quillaja saponaria]
MKRARGTSYMYYYEGLGKKLSVPEGAEENSSKPRMYAKTRKQAFKEKRNQGLCSFPDQKAMVGNKGDSLGKEKEVKVEIEKGGEETEGIEEKKEKVENVEDGKVAGKEKDEKGKGLVDERNQEQVGENDDEQWKWEDWGWGEWNYEDEQIWREWVWNPYWETMNGMSLMGSETGDNEQLVDPWDINDIWNFSTDIKAETPNTETTSEKKM